MAYEQSREDVVRKRTAFMAEQPSLDVTKLVFVDESGFRLGHSPRHGWAPKGQDSIGKTVCGKWKTMTMIGAIALDGFRGFMTVDAATDTDVFQAFVRHQLVPHLHAGDMVVMDNLSVHRNAEVKAMIEQAGATVLFTPPYSPEFNPIEEAWAKMKDVIRRMDTLCRESFDIAVAKAMDAIQLSDILAWVNFAGYSINST